MRIGLISDTHGLVDPRLPGLFRGCGRVLHAGDLVRPEILELLGRSAPVTAVRGNNDEGPALELLPEHALLRLGALGVLVLHDLGPRHRPHPHAQALLSRHRPDVVIHGHSHRPGAEQLDGRLYVNPGSAGPRRFSLPRTVALLTIHGRRAAVAFLDLDADPPRPLGAPIEAAL
jgi:putative phosphoesterase